MCYFRNTAAQKYIFSDIRFRLIRKDKKVFLDSHFWAVAQSGIWPDKNFSCFLPQLRCSTLTRFSYLLLQLSGVWCNFSQSLCFPGRASAKLLGASAIIITITLIVILIFVVTLPIILAFNFPSVLSTTLSVPSPYLGNLEIYFSSQLNGSQMWRFSKAGCLNIFNIWLGLIFLLSGGGMEAFSQGLAKRR